MKVQLINPYSINPRNRLNSHYLNKPDYDATSSFTFEVQGRITFPGGYVDLDATLNNSASTNYYKVPFTWIGSCKWIILQEYTNAMIPPQPTGCPLYAEVVNIQWLSGAIVRLYYRISWLTSYFKAFTTKIGYTNPLAAFTGCRVLMTSGTENIDYWAYRDLQTTGKRLVNITGGSYWGRITDSSYFLVVLKCPNKASAIGIDHKTPQSAYLLSRDQMQRMLKNYTLGDNPDDDTYPSKMLSVIKGIYYLPGVTVTGGGGDPFDTNLNVKISSETACLVTVADSDGNRQDLNLITASATSDLSDNVHEIEYKDGNSARILLSKTDQGFESGGIDLIGKVSGQKDIYYKSHKLFVPYIGIVDIPVTDLIDYNTSGESDLDTSLYLYVDIYEGRMCLHWQGSRIVDIDKSNWISLPEIPLIADGSGIQYYQNNAKYDMQLMNAGISALTSVTTGNVTGLLGAGINAISAGMSKSVSDNIAKASSFTSTPAQGWEGYAENRFLYITDTVVVTEDNEENKRGYAVLTSDITNYTASSKGKRIWLDPTGLDLHMESLSTPDSFIEFDAHIDEIISEISSLNYVIV